MKKKYFTLEEKREAKNSRRRKPSKADKEDFIERIPESGCWIWMGQCWDSGYGYLRKRLNGKIKTISAHRYMYEFYKGPFDKSLDVLHRCDNPSCVNPDHLFLGTHSDNMRDMIQKNRRDFTGSKNPNYRHGKYIK